MTVASIVGLLIPAAEEGDAVAVVSGALAGAAFLLGARRLLRDREVRIGALSGVSVRRSILVFAVLLVHSLPEGFAIGTAYASTREGLGLFVVLAIAIQNVPEGTATAVPMAEAGFSRGQQFWAAVATSAPQPIGAVIAYVLVEEVHALLPVSFAFAAGAMLALVAFELMPAALVRGSRVLGISGTVAGAGLMLALTLVLSV
jgi:ZIP family zinc transporter